MPIYENTLGASYDNPRAIKVSKAHNGKRTNVATMTGVSRATLASTPSLRINQNYLIEIGHGYVDIVMLATATRLNRAILHDSTLGWVKEHSGKRYRARVGRVIDGQFQRSRDLTLTQWDLLASAVFIGAKYPSVETLRLRLVKAVDKAISIDPKLGLSRDRSDNARYDTRIKPKHRSIVGTIQLTDKTPKPSTVKALEKRRSR